MDVADGSVVAVAAPARDLFDLASCFVADSAAALRQTRPALGRAVAGLADDLRKMDNAEAVKNNAMLLATALAKQLDESRLSSSVEPGEELGAAAVAVALIGSAACSRCADLAAASLLLDGALLRARCRAHTSLLQSAHAVLDDLSDASVSGAPSKRPRRADNWSTTNSTAPSAAPHWSRRSQTVQVVEAATSTSESDGQADAMAMAIRDGAEPVLFAGLASSWPALDRWSRPAYLREVAGRRLVPIEVGAAHLETVGADGVGEQTVLRTLADFIDEVIIGGEPATARGADPTAVSPSVPVTAAETIGYLAQHRLFEQVPALAADIHHPKILPEGADVRAWFGPAGVVTPVHYDHHHGLLVQIVGHKRVLLWAPDAREMLRAPPAGSPLANTSPIDPAELTEGSELAGASRCVVLAPGDGLLIPMGWWHHCESLTVSFSVSFWF